MSDSEDTVEEGSIHQGVDGSFEDETSGSEANEVLVEESERLGPREWFTQYKDRNFSNVCVRELDNEKRRI